MHEGLLHVSVILLKVIASPKSSMEMRVPEVHSNGSLAQNMDDTNDRLSVYEIGYLIKSSVPSEKVTSEVEALKKIITDSGASIIAEEMPRHQDLAYTIRTKTVSGAYAKNDEAYFGWIKFELGSSAVVVVKKAFEIHPSVLRSLLVSTVRENTYLGKRASVVAAELGEGSPSLSVEKTTVQKEVAPVSVEEIDKSIDDMVKEV